jgi:2-oxoglutarate dehydrogenase E1 component
MIVFTPKSMLRLKAASSAVADFTGGSFQPLIGDGPDGPDPSAVRRVLLCSGKLYYELAAQRRKSGAGDTAICRIERLYPLPVEELKATLASYPATQELIWVQEEPANMGAWPRVALKLPELLGRTLTRISRSASSAPAAGSAAMHAAEHRAILDAALPGADA